MFHAAEVNEAVLLADKAAVLRAVAVVREDRVVDSARPEPQALRSVTT